MATSVKTWEALERLVVESHRHNIWCGEDQEIDVYDLTDASVIFRLDVHAQGDPSMFVDIQAYTPLTIEAIREHLWLKVVCPEKIRDGRKVEAEHQPIISNGMPPIYCGVSGRHRLTFERR